MDKFVQFESNDFLWKRSNSCNLKLCMQISCIKWIYHFYLHFRRHLGNPFTDESNIPLTMKVTQHSKYIQPNLSLCFRSETRRWDVFPVSHCIIHVMCTSGFAFASSIWRKILSISILFLPWEDLSFCLYLIKLPFL